MSTYKLTYFNVRARGELARLVFHAAGVTFEDYRINRDDWPSIKPTTPFGQIPVLDVDGKPLAQGNAIARLLAREFGLAGKNSWEQALADQYADLSMDLYKDFRPVNFETDVIKKAELTKDFFNQTLPKFFGMFEKGLEQNGGKFFVGSSLTMADLAIYNVVDIMLSNFTVTLDKYPNLNALKASIEAHPNVGKYLKERPATGW